MSSYTEMLIYGCCSTLIFSAVFYVSHRLMIRMCANTNSLQGKTVLITGGNSGIGFEAAKEFARRGACLLLPCRNQAKARAAIEEIIKDTGNEDIRLYKLDTSSLQSVEDLVEELSSSEDIQIDILCLNAGCKPSLKRQESVDGFEYTFAANHLGHFHLTNLIQPLLAPSARIIITSSFMYTLAYLNFANMQLEKFYFRTLAYSRSKLMNVYHMLELSRRLFRHGIAVNALEPGVVITPMWSEGSSYIDWFLSRTVVPTFGKTAWEGAQTIIHLATCDKVEGVTGQLFSECRPHWLVGFGRDREASRKAWEYCEQIIADWKEKRQSTNGKYLQHNLSKSS